MCSPRSFEENDVVLQQNGNSLSGETKCGVGLLSSVPFVVSMFRSPDASCFGEEP